MSSPIVTPATHTVKHRKAEYLVLSPAGKPVARYAYSPEQFDTRRRAYRDALADAAVRDEAQVIAAGKAWAEAA